MQTLTLPASASYLLSPSHCPPLPLCGQRLSRREYAKTTVVKTADRGHGLIAAEAIPAHALIHEYCGEVISVSECYARLSGYQAEGLSDFYMFRLSPQLVIDARLMGNAARFINHSCDANAYTQSWTVGPQQRVGIWAKRDIHKGEEVTYDYNAQTFNARGEDDAVIQHCRCGAANCSRYLGERVKQGRKGRKSEAVADVESGEKGQRKKKRKQRKVKRRSGVRVEGEARVVGDSAEVKSGSKATKAASGGSADADAKARRREERRRSRQMEERNRMKEAEQASDGGAAAGVKAKRRTKEKERGRPDGPTTVRAAKADSSALTKASAGRARQAAAREDGMGRKRAREASAVDDDEPLSVVRLRAREAALEEDDVPLSDLRLRLRLDEEEEPLSDLRKRLRLEAVEEQMVQRKKGEKLTSTRATTVRRPPVHCALDVVERSAGEDAAVEISSTASLHAASRQRRAPQGSDTESETEETATEPPLPSLLPPSVPGADSGTESDSEHDHELLLRPAQMRGSNLCDVTARMDDDDGDLTSSSSLSTDSFLTHSSSTLAHSFMHVAAGKGFIGGEGVESEAMSDVIAKPLTTEVM